MSVATSWNRVVCVALMACAGALPGCSRKERVAEIEAPGVHIKVDKDKSSGGIDVDVKHDRD